MRIPEHPFVNVVDLESKSIQELSETINTLNNKLAYMHRLNNFNMIRQLEMVVATYRQILDKKQRELWDKKSKDLEKKIDIT